MKYTASGARRTGDEYQDLLSAEVLISWLERPDAYRWVRLEAMDGSLDDIQIEMSDGKRRLLQVKFGTDETAEWDWATLMKQEPGKRGMKPSLLMKWQASLDKAHTSGTIIQEAALLTNRPACASIESHLTDIDTIDFDSLSATLQATLSAHMNGRAAAAAFFKVFRFRFSQPPLDSLAELLRARFKQRGGSLPGWENLLKKIKRWINVQDEPAPDGKISLFDVRMAALWHFPPEIPQNFLVPPDYVAPSTWSDKYVEPKLAEGTGNVLIITGTPGAGKSTYLSWLVSRLRLLEIPAVRHHYLLSTTDSTRRRTDWETAADAIIGQLRSDYPTLVSEAENRNPQPDTLPTFLEAAGQKRMGLHPVVVIVDGLDHVWRDTGSEEGLRVLFDLLLPAPRGVVIVVGTQTIDVSKLPRKLRDTCPQNSWLCLPFLDTVEVREWLHHHAADLGLPEEEEYAQHRLDELSTAFHEVSSGHPLILHYTLSAASQVASPIYAHDIRTLPSFNPKSAVAGYYESLWSSIESEGHQLLHLLAGFRWPWPRYGLVQCLAAQADPVGLERSEQAVRHVLGITRAGVTAFHESLLAFIRARPDHASWVQACRPRVLNWLTHQSPEYWRWRYEWEELASCGYPTTLITSPTLDWCIHSLAKGRRLGEIAEIVASSGWAALRAGDIAIATERHYIDRYLDIAGNHSEVLAKIMHTALRGQRDQDARATEQELNVLLAQKARLSTAALAVLAELAFMAGDSSCNQELFDEYRDRLRSASARHELYQNDLSSLTQYLPIVLAAALPESGYGPFRKYVMEHSAEPPWCSGEDYAKALFVLCTVGDDTARQRDELRFIANAECAGFEAAVAMIVRLACREGFDPSAWLPNVLARRSGLYRCYQFWLSARNTECAEPPLDIQFSVGQRGYRTENRRQFGDIAWSFYFSSMACAAEGRDRPSIAGLGNKASKALDFLDILGTIAADAVRSRRQGVIVGGAWFLMTLATHRPPVVKANDLDNDIVQRASVAGIVVTIAQDIEDLQYAATGNSSLDWPIVLQSIESGWTLPTIWIEQSVRRRVTFGDHQIARELVSRERSRLADTRDYLETRASEYATLARFCQLHGLSHNEVYDVTYLSARNLLGHGFHKDMILFEVLEAIQLAPCQHRETTLARLKVLSPVIRIIQSITDGDETRHLKRELGEVLWKLTPDALPSYLRALQDDGEHTWVEACYTDIATIIPLETDFEVELSSTLVHDEALFSIQSRAESGDAMAASLIAGMLEYCGLVRIQPARSSSTSSLAQERESAEFPSIEDYPPSKLDSFIAALRRRNIHSDDGMATWVAYWRERDIDGLAASIANFRNDLLGVRDKLTARLVAELVLEREGRRAAWEWLVSYHKDFYGWSSYTYKVDYVEWIWVMIGKRYKERWLEFIIETSRPKWSSAGGAPAWSLPRLVRYLIVIGQGGQVNEIVDAAVRWSGGLAADMRLPDSALVPTPSSDLPVTLQLLLDRLDCPSRMVQERAAWSVARLLAMPRSHEATSEALLAWHAMSALEMRSCMLLLILHVARAAHGLSESAGLDIARRAQLVPSIGVALLLREFGEGDGGTTMASALDSMSRHSGNAVGASTRADDFTLTVSAHLAPFFNRLATLLDAQGVDFMRQWEAEASNLARAERLSLRINDHFPYHYRGGVDGLALPINDRVAMLLRSAYLRALHWACDVGGLLREQAIDQAYEVAVLASPSLWAAGPTPRPGWWPDVVVELEGVDGLLPAVAEAVRARVETLQGSQSARVIAFAAGPVGDHPRLSAELELRGFLQAATGSLKPRMSDLNDLIERDIVCLPESRSIALRGRYYAAPSQRYAHLVRGWLMAPLAWKLFPSVEDWLRPDHQLRGIYLPASWIFDGEPMVSTAVRQLSVSAAGRAVAEARYWHGGLRERRYDGSFSRVGVELTVDRSCFERHLSAGAALCWVATLRVLQRKEYSEGFEAPHLTATWEIGGSRIVRPNPWKPPSSR